MTNIVDLRSASRTLQPARVAHDVAAPVVPQPSPPVVESEPVDETPEPLLPESALQAMPEQDDALLDRLLAAAVPGPVAWEASTKATPKQQSRRYVLMSALAVIGGGIAFWQGTWATLLIVLLGCGLWELRERLHHTTSVAIDDRGVTVNGTHLPHAQLTSFDIHILPDGSHELSIHTAAWSMPRARIPLGSQDPAAVLAILNQYVPRQDHPLPLVDWFLHR